jgi:hypothetical protein
MILIRKVYAIPTVEMGLWNQERHVMMATNRIMTDAQNHVKKIA